MHPLRRLLVIDDQHLDRAVSSHAAKRAGFKTFSADGIAATRDLLEQGIRFDYVVLDLVLGSEDGLALLPLLAHFNKSAIVIFVSGLDRRVLGASHRLARFLGLQVAGVLRKPVIPAQLISLLHLPLDEPRNNIDMISDIHPEQIRLAIAEGHIRSWFQPKTSLIDGTIVGAEALARWTKPDGRSVSAFSLVAVAEQSGLISALTDTILEQALRECARWRRQRPDCRVAVNLSPLQLNDPGLTDRIEAKLQSSGVPPGSLVLEITEGCGIPDTPRAIEILTRLRIRGVHLSIDDFGTGHSGLLSLVRMPFDEMKIDGAFVRDASGNSDAHKVVRASAMLGRELGLNVVAEGVETKAMARLVEEAGCHVGQGWIYGRAVPPDVFAGELGSSPRNAEPCLRGDEANPALDDAPLPSCPDDGIGVATALIGHQRRESTRN